jgi:hypothetical protein
MPKIQTYKELKTKLDIFENCVRNICKEERGSNIFVCAGDPGLGKTYKARAILNELLNKKQIKAFEEVNSNMKPFTLYQKMWKLREGGVILIDDVNDILEDKKVGIPLLKAATDSYAVRPVSWNTNDYRVVKVSKFNPKDNDEVFEKFNAICDSKTKLFALRESGDAVPDKFYFKGVIIVITNKSWIAFDKLSDGAIGNRGLHMELRVTLDCAIEYVKKVAPTMKEYLTLKLNKKIIDPVLKYITTDKDVLNYYLSECVKPGIRILGKMCDSYINSGGKNGLTLDNLKAATTKEVNN